MDGDRQRTARVIAGTYPLKKIAICLLDIYKTCISPFIPTQCRFYPTCSSYMQEAIEKKGIFRGLACGIMRILRCHPFSRGGYDPVK
ncbi:MAG TPA: membrane protein insertion efficiency factor YidD [Syntrophorhabdus sp.]|nr:membrane protein insertion efficiency factor YidD [Syntrophorhabdus sp.]MDI9558387.1 membrane protein insertion efficiency factor YidD [Pseudomonadota bacterium]MBP8744144.1 membrane protein insertion efficiency factor YidD [Syntrophorhabdus sp.]NMC94304.1 membrane protein insertion efficiency factor YidD [Syntrophorhabdus sp.]HNS79053.1 membrane protein insertion efficiency factor YidD [Syntrophorhabdus sp.]